eukprot:317236_1
MIKPVSVTLYWFRIIRLVQSDRDLHTKWKRNTKLKHNRKKYIKQSLIYFLDAIWIVFYLISHRIVLVKKDQSQQHSTVIVIPNLLRFSVTHSRQFTQDNQSNPSISSEKIRKATNVTITIYCTDHSTHLIAAVRQMKRTNVFDDTFHIYHDEPMQRVRPHTI